MGCTALWNSEGLTVEPRLPRQVPPFPAAVEAVWYEEINRRITDLESGRVQGIPIEETLAKARAIVEAATASAARAMVANLVANAGFEGSGQGMRIPGIPADY